MSKSNDRRAVLRELVDDALGEHRGKATLTVEETASVLKVGRSAAYEAVRAGSIPSVRIGRRVVVPVPALAAVLLGTKN
jgi:excisionase family DNA binding protein